MSHFIETQSRRLAEEVDKYAQKLGFLEEPGRDFDGQKTPGESVPVESVKLGEDRLLVFTFGGHTVQAVITERDDCYAEGSAIIFPCGQHLDRLVKKAAQAVVHALFEPE